MASFRLSERIRDTITRVLYSISPLWLVQYRYKKATGKWYRPGNPRTLDEKLLWLMLYWRHPLKSRCADKYAVRSYVEENGLGHLLNGLLGVYTSSKEIDFDSLPDRFALKCTHGCGFNIICADKSRLDVDEARRKLDAWMKVDISKFGAELHYASIKPRIICEKFLEDRSGKLLNDYKVYCFDGKAHCTMACTDRSERGAKYDFYDREWKNKLAYSKSSLLANRNIPKPDAYEEIIEAAEKLSKPFPFVRMDLYSVNGRAVFGEMTFTPNGSIDTYMTDLAQIVMGDLLSLPEELSPVNQGRTGSFRPDKERMTTIIMAKLTKACELAGHFVTRIYARQSMPGNETADRLMTFCVALNFWIRHRYWPNLKNPRSFSEKVFHRMLSDRDPVWTTISDKLLIREFVSARTDRDYLIPLLWRGDDPEDIPFDKLPLKYIIKTNHGCGYNIIVMDNKQVDRLKAVGLLKTWLDENFGMNTFLGAAWAYKNIRPAVLIEQFLDDKGKPPLDYKFFCFGGRAEYVLMTFDRHSAPYEKHFSRDFVPLDLWNGCRQFPGRIERPRNYEEMVSLAESLAHDFDFIRVDLYNLDGRIYFSELTCYPAGGLARFIPREYDFIFGEKWNLGRHRPTATI